MALSQNGYGTVPRATRESFVFVQTRNLLAPTVPQERLLPLTSTGPQKLGVSLKPKYRNILCPSTGSEDVSIKEMKGEDKENQEQRTQSTQSKEHEAKQRTLREKTQMKKKNHGKKTRTTKRENEGGMGENKKEEDK